MQKTKKNPYHIKFEVDNLGSVPTYSDLNAFMRPSKISPLYTEKAVNTEMGSNYDDSDHDGDNHHDDDDDDSISSSADSQISDSLYHVDSDNEQIDSSSLVDDEYANDIAENDKNIYNMKCILENKKQLLLYKNREIKELAKQNSFLNSILSDYEKIKLRILEEKRKQQDAIKIISKHISQISKNMNEDDYHIEQLQDDQSLMLKELEKIRMEVKEVMQS
jgi:hypothetical protein